MLSEIVLHRQEMSRSVSWRQTFLVFLFGYFFIKFSSSLLRQQEYGATFVVLMKPRWTQSSRPHRKLTSKSFLSSCLKEKRWENAERAFFVGINCRIFTLMDLWLMTMWNKEERFIHQVDAVLLIYKCVWVCDRKRGTFLLDLTPTPMSK